MPGVPAAGSGCRCSSAGHLAISTPTCPISSARSRAGGRRSSAPSRAERWSRSSAPAGWIDEAAGRVRAYARRAISRTVRPWSAQSAAIVAAIVIGDRAGLDDDVQRRLQEAGTYHVMAISGGNIAIVAGLMLAAFRLAGMLGRVAMLSAIVVLLAYARLVGGGASVDRATLMAVTYFAARFVDQRSPPLNALAFVAACLVAAQPLSVVDPAFILTFGATLAILALASRGSPGGTGRAWSSWRAAMLAASVATEIVLLPVGALVFSRVTFAGLVLNFAAIPLMTVVQLAGMALVPAALVAEPVARGLGYVAHLAAAGLIRTADFVSLVPVLAFRVAPPRGAVVAVYYTALASALALLELDALASSICRRRGRRRDSGLSPSRGRFSPPVATAVCTSRSSTSRRAMPRSSASRGDRRCSWTAAGSRRSRRSTSATASLRRFCGRWACGGSTCSH